MKCLQSEGRSPTRQAEAKAKVELTLDLNLNLLREPQRASATQQVGLFQ